MSSSYQWDSYLVTLGLVIACKWLRLGCITLPACQNVTYARVYHAASRSSVRWVHVYYSERTTDTVFRPWQPLDSHGLRCWSLTYCDKTTSGVSLLLTTSLSLVTTHKQSLALRTTPPSRPSRPTHASSRVTLKSVRVCRRTLSPSWHSPCSGRFLRSNQVI
jgi:hypothetical protein